MEIANTIDEKLFVEYTRRRAKVIKEIIKRGILDGIDWSTLKQPFGNTPPKKSVDNRCPTIRSPSPFITSHYSCASFLHLAGNSPPRDDGTS